VDEIYSRFDLRRPSGYRAFLQAQFDCFAPIEDVLAAGGVGELLQDWPQRRRAPLLIADLADLDAEPAPAAASPLSLTSIGAILGAVYVLEGSRFGAALLARRLPPTAPARFLGAVADPAAWRALVATMDRRLDDEDSLVAAVAAARAVFAAFAASGQLRLEAA
jgi:heme oxygenase